MIVSTISEVKKVLHISNATSFDMLKTHLANAELAFIIPLLGKKMYDALNEFAASPNKEYHALPGIALVLPAEQPDNEKAWALMLWYSQHAVVHLAYFMGFDMLNAYISDGGFKRSESENIKSLFKYQEDSLKRYFIDSGMNSLDTMLEIMGNNPSVFDEFDEQRKLMNSKIFPSVKTFENHYFINKSRLTFLRLQQHIKTIEELEITPAIGADNMNYLYAELAKEEPSEKALKLLPFVRDPVAYLSTAMLMQESGADLTERGLYFRGNKSISNADFVMPAAETRIAELVRRNKELGQMYLSRLKTHILNNPEWDNIQITRSRLHNRDNDGKKTFVA